MLTRLRKLYGDARALSLCRYYSKVVADSISFAEESISRPNTDRRSVQWRIVSSLCLARFPKLIRPKMELQLQFEAIQEQLRLERSRLSDYELEEIKIKEIMEEIERKAKLDELVDDQTASAPEKFQEADAARRQALTEFIPAARITQADTENDLHSLDRKLDHMLYLIVKKRQPDSSWLMPQGVHEGEESLLETAKKELIEECGSELIPLFLSRSPCAYMAYHLAEPGQSEIGSKVFFFKAQLRGGKVNLNSDKLEDFAWVTKAEMKEYVPKDFYKAIEPILLD